MLEFGKDVVIEDGAIINVKEGMIGDRTIIRAGARVEGNHVELGTESYLDYGAWIGGGSCFDSRASLTTGDWFHMGWNCQVNIARGVIAGHGIGLGVETKIFTHGAYPPIDMGFPVQWGPVKIGSNAWLPNAWVNPGIDIGANTVVAAGSVINKSLPQGCLAAGVPCRVIKENVYPRIIDKAELNDMLIEALSVLDFAIHVENAIVSVDYNLAVFDIPKRIVFGTVSTASEIVKNQLRRNGIRFRYTNKDGRYKPW